MKFEAKAKQRESELQHKKNELNFELSDELANGLYVISLTSDTGNGQLKVIKQ